MPPEPIDDRLIALWRELCPALVLYARTWAGADEAEDVVQSVFVRLLSQARRRSEPRPRELRPWLFRCVRNEAISWRRSWRRRLRREDAAARRPVFAPSVEDRFDAAAVQQALERLPATQREIVVLRIWSGLTLAEASVVMNAPVSTLHDQYRLAISQLGQLLEPTCSTTTLKKKPSR